MEIYDNIMDYSTNPLKSLIIFVQSIPNHPSPREMTCEGMESPRSWLARARVGKVGGRFFRHVHNYRFGDKYGHVRMLKVFQVGGQ